MAASGLYRGRPIVDRPLDREVALARDWHGGQSSMLYAVASTGVLALGSIRPAHCFNDEDWADDLRFLLSVEVAQVSAEARKADNLDDVEVCEAWLLRLGYDVRRPLPGGEEA